MDLELEACEDDADRRLDRILRKRFASLPLSAVHRLLRTGAVLVNGAPAGGSLRIAYGDRIYVKGIAEESKPLPVLRSQSPLTLLYSDADIAAFNKPRGLAVHGGMVSMDSLAAPLLEGRRSLSFRPGPLHRLDTPTSGVLVFSRTLRGARLFTAALKAGKLRKFYIGVTDGITDGVTLTGSASWEDTLIRDKKCKITLKAEDAGQTSSTPHTAVTIVTPLLRRGGHSLCLFEILTGRTHQIRCQAAIHGYPLSGDRKYGGSPQEGGLLLHCLRLDLSALPGFPQEISAPLPGYFKRRIGELFGEEEAALAQKNIERFFAK
jgi:23S rRNA pseudouridine955/2504/2580 synthase